jgi:ribonuclease HII
MSKSQTVKSRKAGSKPDFSFEASYGGLVAGTDEAGRGPWAGPVVAAAVILNRDDLPAGLNDSKKLSEVRREALYDVILKKAISVGIAEGSLDDIERLNILHASLDAMARAVGNLLPQPDFVLIDGNRAPQLTLPHKTLVKGDGRSLSIAAASIIAKVTRDRLMRKLDLDFPEYEWASNKGYGTKAHKNALATHGVTQHHRRRFAPIHKMLIDM